MKNIKLTINRPDSLGLLYPATIFNNKDRKDKIFTLNKIRQDYFLQNCRKVIEMKRIDVTEYKENGIYRSTIPILSTTIFGEKFYFQSKDLMIYLNDLRYILSEKLNS